MIINMRIGIVTLFGNFNYGNRLQNYALHTVLSQMGHDVDTLVTLEKSSALKSIFHKFFEKENGAIRLRTKKEHGRDAAFSKFTDSLIPTRIISTNGSGLSTQLNDEYDYFVVGSDQVWNPLWWGDSLECRCANDYLLQFADANKRVAYSASFGLASLPENWVSAFREALEKYANISVREDAGARIVEELTGRKVPVTLDPTMLLTANQWRKIEKPVACKQKYVFQFNLGEQSDAQVKLTTELKSLGYEIVDYMNPKCRYFGGDPSDFLSYIDKADCVLTDSFHASVFSILFKRPFVVFDRQHANGSNMNSRINTLLQTCALEDRWGISDATSALACDYSGVDCAIDIYRADSETYLRRALVR